MANASAAFGHVVIGGGTGFIGSAIASALRHLGVQVTIISRMPGNERISWHQLQEDGLPTSTNAVINVSGQNVLDPRRRWTPGFKQNVISSRVNTTKNLAEAIKNANPKPKVFVTISGVGCYTPSQTAEYTEDSSCSGDDFMSFLCRQWEDAAKLPPELGVRNVIIRSGVVLGRHGGIIKNIWLPFWFGLGGRIGSGKQFMPWIHIDDLVGLFLFSIEENHVTGVLNGVAPDIITNYQFTKAVGKNMWRPTIFPMPQFVLNFLFSPERAIMMTEGQKVIPERVLKLGYQYMFPHINSACKSIFYH